MEPNIDKIEQYITGAMAAAERQAFEAEVASDPDLAEEVEAYRLAREAVELSISDQLRDQFRQWGEVEATGTINEEAQVVRLRPRHSLRRVLAIAASVLLILAVGSFWYANDQYAADQLAAGYFDSSSADTRGPVNNQGHPLAEGLEALQSGDYAAADNYFQNIPATDENYADARYFLAQSLHLQGKTDESTDILRGLLDQANINLRESAQWLIVLNYLKNGQVEDPEFQSRLNAIQADTGHSYYQEAEKLDRQLNSFWYKMAN